MILTKGKNLPTQDVISYIKDQSKGESRATGDSAGVEDCLEWYRGGLCFHVDLRVPRYADLGGHVVLKCEYNVMPEQLHKVEWLKGGRKIFQYVKGRTPPFRNYTTPGALLDEEAPILSKPILQ
uniref:Ig-like domain-containing protein n=1 Tax=Rhodnius prolixus TaxID=13249 RepID=T1I2B0_RHOPR